MEPRIIRIERIKRGKVIAISFISRKGDKIYGFIKPIYSLE